MKKSVIQEWANSQAIWNYSTYTPSKTITDAVKEKENNK